MSQYPDNIDLPLHADPSPDQQYYVGWMVQHNRLWVAFAGIGLLAFVLAGLLLLQTARFKPSVTYVTLDGAYPVLWNERGNVVVDGTEYVPARLRAVVQTFVENRYQYNYQKPYLINTALRYMSAKAAEEEKSKFARFDFAKTIMATQTVLALRIDYSNFKVVAKGKGIFEVTLEGTASINDAIRYPDPQSPATKPVTIRLTLQTVKESDVNPLGYVVIATDKDIL